MGNVPSGEGFDRVDALKHQLSSLEQKLASIEAMHQRTTVWPTQGGETGGNDVQICGAHLRCRRDVRVILGPVVACSAHVGVPDGLHFEDAVLLGERVEGAEEVVQQEHDLRDMILDLMVVVGCTGR